MQKLKDKFDTEPLCCDRYRLAVDRFRPVVHFEEGHSFSFINYKSHHVSELVDFDSVCSHVKDGKDGASDGPGQVASRDCDCACTIHVKGAGASHGEYASRNRELAICNGWQECARGGREVCAHQGCGECAGECHVASAGKGNETGSSGEFVNGNRLISHAFMPLQDPQQKQGTNAIKAVQLKFLSLKS